MLLRNVKAAKGALSTRRLSPLLLEWTAYLHVLVGIIIYFDVLQAIAAEGIVNAIDGHYDRSAAFWFLFSGAFIWLSALLMKWAVRERGLPLPSRFGWILTALSVIGIVLMPVSGFWLALPQGVLIALNAGRPG